MNDNLRKYIIESCDLFIKKHHVIKNKNGKVFVNNVRSFKKDLGLLVFRNDCLLDRQPPVKSSMLMFHFANQLISML